MGKNSLRCDAVLIFEKRRLFDGDMLERMATRILAAKGFEVQSSVSETDFDLTLTTRDFTLSARSDGAADADGLMGRMIIAITDISEDLHADSPLVLLAEICRKAILATEASQIVWLRKDVVFSAQQFLSAFGPVRPRRVARKAAQRPAPRRSASGRAHQEASQRLPHIAVTEERLDREFQELQTAHELTWTENFTDADEAALAEAIRVDENGRHDSEPEVPLTRATRITTWVMTAMIALFSLPVAAGMATINILKGEDFRLSAHALALTGSFATLDQIGATQQAMLMVFC